MAQVINTNIMSLNAQRNLNRSANDLQVSLQRLSSGLRINSAKDDAAGLAISDRFTTQIRGLNQAIRNANDGTSLAQTGEGALAEITNNLQRIRELAVQSANATNSASDRAALDQEVQQRLAEIERIATQTSFNGQKILDGTFGNATFQVGANVGETITVGLSTSMRTTAIGKTADYVSGAAYNSALAVGQQGAGVDTSALASGDVKIAIGTGDVVSVGVSSAGTGAGQSAASAFAKAAAINASGISGLTATADTTLEVSFTALASTGAADSYDLEINDVAVYTGAATDIGDLGGLTGDDVAAAITANASATGVTASFNSGANTITLSAIDGRDIKIEQTRGANATGGFTATTAINNTANASDTILADGTAYTAVGSIRLVSTEAINLSSSTTPARIGFTAASFALGNSAINSASVTSVENANTAITRVDAALTSVSSLRSTFGAIQNRFESTIANLSATTENLSASRSRILDADFAAETAALTRAQILQQAGVAMVAQANVLPQTVLALLQ